MWGDGDDGVFGVVLAEGFCICDINRSRSAWEMAKCGGGGEIKVRPSGRKGFTFTVEPAQVNGDCMSRAHLRGRQPALAISFPRVRGHPGSPQFHGRCDIQWGDVSRSARMWTTGRRGRCTR